MARILVIEDDVAFREPLVKMITNDGHQVDVAGDGLVALELLKTIRPELIITDVSMPNMDGIEMIETLSCAGGTTPIIVMSGGRRAVRTDFKWASPLMMGVKVTLVKPFAHSALREAIAYALATAQPAVN